MGEIIAPELYFGRREEKKVTSLISFSFKKEDKIKSAVPYATLAEGG